VRLNFVITIAFLGAGAAAAPTTPPPPPTPAPSQPPRATDVYHQARAEARAGKSAEAVVDLERALAMGFTDFPRIEREPDFNPVRNQPRFRGLIAAKDVWLRRTAEGTLVALRNRFGTNSYRYEIDREERLVYAVALDDAAFQRLRASLKEESIALGTALFEHKLDAYVTLLMPRVADYGKLVRFRNVPGLYVDDMKTLVAKVDAAGYVLPHEFAHALHAADLAPIGQKHAVWVAEGLGVLCEAADFSGGRFAPRDNPRFAALPAAAGRKALVPLERLVAMDAQEFRHRPNLTYGQSGYLMLYLWDKGLLKKFYDAYKSTYATDATGRKALEDVTGKPIGQIHEDWRQWLAARHSGKREMAPAGR
jgi:hypothetical protein